MEKNKSVIDIIFAEYNNFFEAEKKIADYILNNREKVIEMTISELAEEAGSSEATVTRFCKKCYMKGFHHLKLTLAQEIVDSKKEKFNISGSVTESSIKESLNNILANKIEELKQTISMINEDDLKKILELLRNARTVQFVAVGNTIPVALDGSYKLNQIGIMAVANTIWETQIAYTYNLTKENGEWKCTDNFVSTESQINKTMTDNTILWWILGIIGSLITYFITYVQIDSLF